MKQSRMFHSSRRAGRIAGTMALIAGTAAALVLGLGAPAAQAAPGSAHLLRGATAPAPSRAPLLHQSVTPAARGGWKQVGEITGTSGSLYGYNVAISGNTMVVGAPSNNTAYVYTGSGSNWTQVATLTPSDGVAGDFFGGAVAISGSIIVVGAYNHGLANEGAAYIFTGSGSSWSQAAELIDPGKAVNDFFGYSVAVSKNSVLVGASGENSNQGSVFIYLTKGGTWAQKAVLSDPGGVDNDTFGFSLATAGRTLVVGAIGDNSYQGAAYVFTEVRGGWVESAKLTANNGRGCVTTCVKGYNLAGGDYFGYSVAFHSDVIAVGAAFASVPPASDGVGSGTAYVFTGAGSSWAQAAEISDPAEVTAGGNDWFGFSVAVTGKNSVVVTAPYDLAGAATGAAFVFTSGGGWPSTPTKLTAGDGAPGDYFGWQGLATKANYIVVGSPYSPNGGIYFYKS